MKELLRLISIPFIFKTINTALQYEKFQQNTHNLARCAQSLDFGKNQLCAAGKENYTKLEAESANQMR